MKRILLAGVAALSLAIGAPQALSAQAETLQTGTMVAGPCPGVMLARNALVKKNGTMTAGHTELWYANFNNGTNCALTYDDLAGPHLLEADIAIPGMTPNKDVGSFEGYAGPVSVGNTNGKCVWNYGWMYYDSYEWLYASPWRFCS